MNFKKETESIREDQAVDIIVRKENDKYLKI